MVVCNLNHREHEAEKRREKHLIEDFERDVSVVTVARAFQKQNKNQLAEYHTSDGSV